MTRRDYTPRPWQAPMTGHLLGAAGALEAVPGATEGPGLRADQVRLLPVIPNPGKLICVGLNYKSHVAETKRPDSDYPSLFLRFNDSLAAHDDVVLPEDAGFTEAERPNTWERSRSPDFISRPLASDAPTA